MGLRDNSLLTDEEQKLLTDKWGKDLLLKQAEIAAVIFGTINTSKTGQFN